MNGILQDTRYASRSLAASPGFTAVAVATLALGIGANTAIFSVVHAVLLSPLDYDDPDRLVMIRGRWPVRGVEKAGLSPGNIADFIHDTTAFEEIAALQLSTVALTDGQGEPEQVRIGFTTPNFFRVVGVRPGLGRAFADGDPNATVILSHGLWERRYGGDPEILGGHIDVGGVSSTVVGVLSPETALHVPEQVGVARSDTALWRVVNLDVNPDSAARRGYGWRVFARLASGANLAQAQQQADAMAAYSRANYEDAARVNTQFDVATVHDQVVDVIRPTLVALTIAVGFVLLIACANVANLLLVRSNVREREMAVRAALGAGRARLLRQQLVESMLLALAGSAGGILAALAAVRGVLLLDPAGLPRLEEVRVDTTVLGFCLALAVVTALGFGLLPGIRASSRSFVNVLRQGGRGAGVGRRALGRTLIVAEVALSVMLLIGAGLAGRSFLSLSGLELGFEPASVLSFRAAVPPRVHGEVEAALAALPGVDAVGATSILPLAGSARRGPFLPDTIARDDTSRYPFSFRRYATAGYLEAMGIELRAGRYFNEDDIGLSNNDGSAQSGGDSPPRRVIIDQTLADDTWPGIDPIGRTLQRPEFADPEQPWEVVGVVGDVREETVRDPGPGTIYFPVPGRAVFVVRSALPPESLFPAARAAIASVAPNVPVHQVESLTGVVDDALAHDRIATTLAGTFAVSALLLAAVGLYGVISYSVGQRGHELGVRMALGARQLDVSQMVLTDGLRLAMGGALVGLAGSILVGRLLSSRLYGVSATDPLTYVGVTALLLTVAAVAAYVPARRAAANDPMMALRRT